MLSFIGSLVVSGLIGAGVWWLLDNVKIKAGVKRRDRK